MFFGAKFGNCRGLVNCAFINTGLKAGVNESRGGCNVRGRTSTFDLGAVKLLSQRLIEVVDQVAGVFEAYRHAEQAFW
jgi:hypothetical protein